MDFYAVLDQVLALLRQRQRVTYRALKVQFQLDDEALEALRDELIEAQHLAADEVGKVLVWTGEAGSSPVPAQEPVRAPHAYTPPHLAEKILTSRNALAGERKQVTVLFADLKGSMELLADRDPEEARQLLDPVLEHMMAAVHRYAGTVNQVMGDGIMALFGAPIAHEDHSLLGAAYALYGRIAEALPLLEQAVEHAHTRQLIANQALWLANLGEAYLLAGCLNDACTRAGQALEFARGHKGRGHEAYALRLLGEVTAQRESPETEPAETHYRQALAVGRRTRHAPTPGPLPSGPRHAVSRRHSASRLALPYPPPPRFMPIWENAFLCSSGPRVAVSGLHRDSFATPHHTKMCS
jgi:class 3 adenylate cyclase